jgi:hypothetical protein
VLPHTAIDAFTRIAHPGDPLHIRLHADAPIVNISGRLHGPNIARDNPTWHPIDTHTNSDGWAIFHPDTPWPQGATLTFTASATTASGANIGPFSYDFLILNDDETTGTHRRDDAENRIPPLPASLGPRYHITPDAVFTTPQRIALPLPNSAPVTLYYFYDDALGGRWYPAEHVLGWTLPDTQTITWENGQYWYTIELRHGGIVQLASPPAPALQPAAAVPAGRLGDLAAASLLLITLLLARSRFPRPH